MSRVLVWVGGTIFLVAGALLGVYLGRVGLATADQLASVVGAAISAIGLTITIVGLLGEARRRHKAQPESGAPVSLSGSNSGIIVVGDNNTLSTDRRLP